MDSEGLQIGHSEEVVSYDDAVYWFRRLLYMETSGEGVADDYEVGFVPFVSVAELLKDDGLRARVCALIDTLLGVTPLFVEREYALKGRTGYGRWKAILRYVQVNIDEMFNTVYAN